MYSSIVLEIRMVRAVKESLPQERKKSYSCHKLATDQVILYCVTKTDWLLLVAILLVLDPDIHSNEMLVI